MSEFSLGSYLVVPTPPLLASTYVSTQNQTRVSLSAHWNVSGFLTGVPR